MDIPILEARGMGKRLLLFEDRLRIERNGKYGIGCSKEIPLPDILSMQFYKSTLFNPNYVKLVIQGEIEAPSRFMREYENENTVLYCPTEHLAFENINSAIKEFKNTIAKAEAAKVETETNLEPDTTININALADDKIPPQSKSQPKE